MPDIAAQPYKPICAMKNLFLKCYLNFTNKIYKLISYKKNCKIMLGILIDEPYSPWGGLYAPPPAVFFWNVLKNLNAFHTGIFLTFPNSLLWMPKKYSFTLFRGFLFLVGKIAHEEKSTLYVNFFHQKYY